MDEQLSGSRLQAAILEHYPSWKLNQQTTSDLLVDLIDQEDLKKWELAASCYRYLDDHMPQLNDDQVDLQQLTILQSCRQLIDTYLRNLKRKKIDSRLDKMEQLVEFDLEQLRAYQTRLLELTGKWFAQHIDSADQQLTDVAASTDQVAFLWSLYGFANKQIKRQ